MKFEMCDDGMYGINDVSGRLYCDCELGEWPPESVRTESTLPVP